MACRKAAYRSMVEVSEWKEEQQAKAHAKLRQIRQELEPIWTPKHIFDQCCAQFIQYGSGVYLNSTAECSGACGKAHPKIMLDFRNQKAVARLSHALDPFVRYFERLCQQGLATKKNSNELEYQLNGFLQDHLEKLNLSKVFPKHIIQVSPLALAASRRAHERFLEHQEELEWCTAKRRKRRGTDRHLFESVFEVCYLHNLLEHLDLCEIAWMRLSGNPVMAKIAAKMASARLQHISLSCSRVFLDNTLDSGPRQALVLDDSKDKQVFFVSASDSSLSLHDAYVHDDVVLRIYLERLSLPKPYESSRVPEHECLFSVNAEGPLQIFEWNRTQQNDSNVIQCRYGTTSRLWEVVFGFRNLLGVYVRKKLAMEKIKLQDIKTKRPATRSEKEYVKALAKEARKAPGNALAYRNFEGW